MKKKILICIFAMAMLASCSNEESESSKTPYVAESIEDTYVSEEQKFNLYTYNFEKDKFEYTEASFHGTIDEIIDKLVEAKSLPIDVKVNSFEINREKDTAYIDLSEEFTEILDWGISQGEASLGCFVDTVIDYYKVKYVEFTVNGKYCETGESVYDYPHEFVQFCVFYTPNNEQTGFNTVRTTYNGTIQGMITALEKVESFPKNVKVNSFEIKEGVAYIDLSSDFMVDLDSGTLHESIVTGVLVNTVIRNYEVEYVMFTVDGEICSTGHVTYDEPMGMMESIA